MFHEIQADYLQTILTEKWDAVVVTTNTIVKQDGSLVMGAGTAKIIAEKYPQIPLEFGRIVRLHNKLGQFNTFPVVCTFYSPVIIGIPTKYNYRDKSSLELVKRSLQQLRILINSLGYMRILLPRPGCALGGLSWSEQVKPLCCQYLDERYWVISL